MTEEQLDAIENWIVAIVRQETKQSSDDLRMEDERNTSYWAVRNAFGVWGDK